MSQEKIAPLDQTRSGAVSCLAALGLCLAVVAVYWPAVDGPFIFDDTATIVENPSLRRLWPLVGSEASPGPLRPPVNSPVAGRPLVNLSLAANYAFGELNPRGYRIVEMALHALTALLLWTIVARTLRLDHFRGRFAKSAQWLGFVSALVWAVHPLTTETVVYVTQRTELAMGLFYLATLYSAKRYWSTTRRTARTVWLVLATSSCITGMLCKEMIASAPAMVLLYERTFLTGSLRKALARSWRLYLGLGLTWLVAIVLNFNGPRTPMTGFALGVSAPEWWLTQAKVFFLYLKLAVWPWPLVIHYEVPYLKTLAEAWPWVLAAFFYGALTLALLWRRRPAGYALTWVVAVLSPTLLIPLVGETVAERRMYVPLMALVPLLIVGGYVLLDWLWRLSTRRSRQVSQSKLPVVFASLAAIVLTIGLGSLSTRRLAAYESGIALWQDAATHQSHDPLVRANLGISLAEAGRFDEAREQFVEWVRLKPESHWAHYNLARSLEGVEQPSEAIKQYRQAIALQPDHGASYYNLARLLEAKKEWADAMQNYRQAIHVQPDFPAAYTNLGLLLLDSGKLPQAIQHLRAALQRQKSLDNHTNLILALAEANQTAEAIALAEEALELANRQDNAVVVEQLESVLKTLRGVSHTR